MGWQYDVFISHASEDKEAIAEPLSDSLKAAGLRVWYDKDNIHLGNTLLHKIDEALVFSRHGVIIFSEEFFTKTWTNREFAALLSLEDDGIERILPILHGITLQRLKQYSPIIGARVCANSAEGVDVIRDRIQRMLAATTSKPSGVTATSVAMIPRVLPSVLSIKYPDLNSQDIEFITATAKGNGHLRLTEPDYGILVNAGGTKFGDDTASMHRTKTRYKASIAKLVIGKYLMQIGSSQTYELADRGINLFDDLNTVA